MIRYGIWHDHDKTLEIVASVAMLTGLGAYLFAVAVLMWAS
jgi:hypothetical protein